MFGLAHDDRNDVFPALPEYQSMIDTMPWARREQHIWGAYNRQALRKSPLLRGIGQAVRFGEDLADGAYRTLYSAGQLVNRGVDHLGRGVSWAARNPFIRKEVLTPLISRYLGPDLRDIYHQAEGYLDPLHRAYSSWRFQRAQSPNPHVGAIPVDRWVRDEHGNAGQGGVFNWDADAVQFDANGHPFYPLGHNPNFAN